VGDAEAGDGHRVVGEHDRRGRRVLGQEPAGGIRPRCDGEVGLDGLAGREAGLPEGRVEGGPAAAAVQERRAAGDVRDAPVAEGNEVAHRFGDAGGVVDRDAREGALGVRPAKGDGGKSEFLQQRDAGVVVPEVAQEALDPARFAIHAG